MKRLLFLLLLVLFCTGCPDFSRQIQAQTATTIAQAANSILPIMIERYRQEGFEALKKVKAEGGSADDARAAIEAVKMRWAPIWKAWETFQIAHDKWADVVERGGDFTTALLTLKQAYCELQGVWPEDMPAVPVSVVRCGG